MEFNKYKERGAYHWEEYEAKTAYGLYVRIVENWIKEKNLLDIGAGDGLITHLLGGVGVDDNEVAVKLAKEKGADVRLGSAYELPFPDNSFDAVLMGDVLEHLETPDIAIKEVVRVLKPNGFFYITTPPARSDRVLQDPYHYREYTEEELVSYLDKMGFTLQEPITTAYARMFAKFQ